MHFLLTVNSLEDSVEELVSVELVECVKDTVHFVVSFTSVGMTSPHIISIRETLVPIAQQLCINVC